jgi:hypothetical protein
MSSIFRIRPDQKAPEGNNVGQKHTTRRKETWKKFCVSSAWEDVKERQKINFFITRVY